MAWLRLAFGNLQVNRRRTAITLLSVAVGVGGLVFLWAFIDGINAQMINNMTGYVTGDLKVHQRGFHDDREMNIALTCSKPWIFSALMKTRSKPSPKT